MRKSVFAKEYLRPTDNWRWPDRWGNLRNSPSHPKTFWFSCIRCFPKEIKPLVKESKQQWSYKTSPYLTSKTISHPMVGVFLQSDHQLCIYVFATPRSHLLPEISFPLKYSEITKSPLLKSIDKPHFSSLQGRLLFEILVLKLFSGHFPVSLHS